MRGDGKPLAEARRFMEAFGLATDDRVDAVLRCSNMLREAKGKGKIDGYVLYGSVGEVALDEFEVQYVAELSVGRGLADRFDERALRLRVCAKNDVRDLPDLVRRALRAMDELKPLASRCSMLHLAHGHLAPAMPMNDDGEDHWKRGQYAEIRSGT